ncbi:MAG: hypothetical protein IKY07_07995 [Clostridia bacterium]|nr:hypothetical protein [Clostridia bacterium]MBR5007016.1 hypothetical protein [Clostridia bacterium]
MDNDSNRTNDRDDQKHPEQNGGQDSGRKQNWNYRGNNFKKKNRNFKQQDQRQQQAQGQNQGQRRDFKKNDGQRQNQREQTDNRSRNFRQQGVLRTEDETAEDIAMEVKAIEAEIEMELNELRSYKVSFGA